MSFNHTISAVLRGRWLIDKGWAEAHLPLVLSLLEGKPVSFVERTGDGEFEQPYAINPATGDKFDWRDGRNANIPPGSVGVIPITGPITKYDGFCGEPGAISHATGLLQMKKRSNIGSVVLHVDTPGGEARAMDSFSSTLKNFGKPVLSLVDGMAASGGMWLVSLTNEVYAANKMSEVGSVGAYTMLADFKGMYEKEGIKLHEIYAPQSTDKNKDYRDAINGDYGMVEEDLKTLVDEFISTVKTGRPGAVANEEKWNTGKMFFAQDAQRIGLIDGIKSFDQVVSKAAWLGKRKKY